MLNDNKGFLKDRIDGASHKDDLPGSRHGNPGGPTLAKIRGPSAQLSIEVVGIPGPVIVVITGIQKGPEGAGLLPAIPKPLP